MPRRGRTREGNPGNRKKPDKCMVFQNLCDESVFFFFPNAVVKTNATEMMNEMRELTIGCDWKISI